MPDITAIWLVLESLMGTCMHRPSGAAYQDLMEDLTPWCCGRYLQGSSVWTMELLQGYKQTLVPGYEFYLQLASQ